MVLLGGLRITIKWRAVVVSLMFVVALQLSVLPALYFKRKLHETYETAVFDETWQRDRLDQNATSYIEELQSSDNYTMMSFSDTLVYPVARRDKGFLTIGIPTIQRKGAFYLLETITSLVSNMSPSEKEEVILVVFLADRHPDIKQKLADEIRAHFNECIETGMMHIIHAPMSYYPDLNITQTTYRQSKQYVRWRAKQAYDYAYLMEYSADLSTYYMQLEDDVLSSPGFIEAIKQFLTKQSLNRWVCLEFSELGFIGKLYRSSDIVKLAALIKLFHIEQPVDYTYLHFNLMKEQMAQRLRRPTLFQHMGTRSSYPGKIQPLKDRFYYIQEKRGVNDNPPADIYSSIPHHMTYFPHLAYSDGTDGYFWTGGLRRKGCDLLVAFHEPHLLHRVRVDSGTGIRPEDRIHKGSLLVGFKLERSEQKVKCLNIYLLGEFEDGRIDVSNLERKMKMKAACLLIKVQKQKSWLIVRNIIVTVSNTTSEEITNA